MRTRDSTLSNTETYACKLPDDIIYELFETAALVYPPPLLVMTPATTQAIAHTNTLLGWVVLTHVCRRWRSIGLSAALAPLWARIVCLSWKPIVARELVQRARDCTLTVDLSRFDGRFGCVLPDCLLLEDWAYEVFGRTSVLILPSRVFLDRLKSQSLVLPNLREIRLGVHSIPYIFHPRWELPGLRTAWLSMQLLPAGLVTTLRELHLRINADYLTLTELRTFLRACTGLEILDVVAIGQWSHEDRPSDTRPERQRRAERAAWKEPIPFERLRQAKLVVGTDEIAIDLWQPIHGAPDMSLELRFASDKYSRVPIPCPRKLFDACERELSCVLYDCLEVSLEGTGSGRRDIRLRLSSSSSSAFCELKFPTDSNTRRMLFSLLPSYISTTAPRIHTLSLDALEADSMDINEALLTLGRALIGVKQLQLRGVDFWSAVFHIRTLCQTNPTPVFPTLQSVRLSDLHLPEMRGPELYITRQWWDTIMSALGTRKEPLERLTMDGKWTGKEKWNESADGKGQKDVGTKSVIEVVDERRWAN